MSESTVRYLSDDASPDEANPVHVEILGHDDYYLSVKGGRLDDPFKAVRFRTSGAEDGNVTMIIAALFHYLKGNKAQSASIMASLSKYIERSANTLVNILNDKAPPSSASIVHRTVQCHNCGNAVNVLDDKANKNNIHREEAQRILASGRLDVRTAMAFIQKVASE